MITHLTAFSNCPDVNSFLRWLLAVMMRMGIRFSRPFVLQILMLRVERQLAQINFQHNSKISMKTLPERTIMSLDSSTRLSILASIDLITANIGVSMYFTILSYSIILSLCTFCGMVVGYKDSTDLMSYKTLTTPVLRPFLKTPELRDKHSATLICSLKMLQALQLDTVLQQSPLLYIL